MLLCSAYSLCPTLCDRMDCNTLSSSVRGDSPGKRSGMGSFSLLQGNLPNPGIEFRSPTLQADSLPSKPPGKPKSTAVDSLSLLQEIFPTQELNRGLLHCGWILYQLRYQGSPIVKTKWGKLSQCFLRGIIQKYELFLLLSLEPERKFRDYIDQNYLNLGQSFIFEQY